MKKYLTWFLSLSMPIFLFSLQILYADTAVISGNISYTGQYSTGTFIIWASTKEPFGDPAIGPEPGPFGDYLVVFSSDVEGNNVFLIMNLKFIQGITTG